MQMQNRQEVHKAMLTARCTLINDSHTAGVQIDQRLPHSRGAHTSVTLTQQGCTHTHTPVTLTQQGCTLLVTLTQQVHSQQH